MHRRQLTIDAHRIHVPTEYCVRYHRSAVHDPSAGRTGRRPAPDASVLSRRQCGQREPATAD